MKKEHIMVNEFERLIGARDDSPANDVADPAEEKRVVNQIQEPEETKEVTPEAPTEVKAEKVTETEDATVTETVTESPADTSGSEGSMTGDAGSDS